MKKVIVIGTIHLDWTPKSELLLEVKKHKPDKIFIELTKKEVEGGRENSIRDEMFFVLNFAEEENIPYYLFDTDINTLKEGVTGKEKGFLEYENKVKKLLSDYSWKDLNSRKPWENSEVKKNEDYIVEKFFDIEKMKQRNELISKNIQENLVEGTNVIVTGAGHITDLLEDLPNSVAPLRKK